MDTPEGAEPEVALQSHQSTQKLGQREESQELACRSSRGNIHCGRSTGRQVESCTPLNPHPVTRL